MRQENKDHLRRSFALALKSFTVRYMKNGKLEINCPKEIAGYGFLLSFGVLLNTLLDHEDEEFDENLLNTATFDATLDKLPKEFVEVLEKVMGKKIVKSTYVPKNNNEN